MQSWLAMHDVNPAPIGVVVVALQPFFPVQKARLAWPMAGVTVVSVLPWMINRGALALVLAQTGLVAALTPPGPYPSTVA